METTFTVIVTLLFLLGTEAIRKTLAKVLEALIAILAVGREILAVLKEIRDKKQQRWDGR